MSGEATAAEADARAQEERPAGTLAARLTERIERLASVGCLPTDSDDVRLRKRALVLTALLIALLAPIWVGVYALLGRPVAASIPGAYWLLTVVGLTYLARTGRFGAFRASQVVMMVILPLLLQSTLGGFAAGSVVMIWAFVSPMGALVWYGPRRAVPWFAAFLAVTVLAGAIDPIVSRGAEPLPEVIRLLFFVLNISGVAFVTYTVLLFFVRGRERALAQLDTAHQQLQVEQDKSERLLENILPTSVAARLKQGEEPIADAYEEVTVLFADVVDFTPLAARLTPEQLVELLNRLFSGFDALAGRLGLEKIKTIGDAYMAVAGVPIARSDHAEAAAEMALAMQSECERALASSQERVRLRIGIHSGPVVAGVIGRRKFAYDLWGDAVNVASRMELHGVPGAIQVSEATAERLRGRYTLEPRGTIEVKGKGEMRTYLLSGRLAEVGDAA